MRNQTQTEPAQYKTTHRDDKRKRIIIVRDILADFYDEENATLTMHYHVASLIVNELEDDE